jgi:hypothetical protein
MQPALCAHRDIFGAREAGLKTVMLDSDQGNKAYPDCVPDYTITDLRDLLNILGIKPKPTQTQLRERGIEDLGPQF